MPTSPSKHSQTRSSFDGKCQVGVVIECAGPCGRSLLGRFIEARDETNSPVGQAEKRETKGKSGTKYHTITRAQKIGVAPLKGRRQRHLSVATPPSASGTSYLGPIRGGSPPPLAVLASALSGRKRDFCALVGKNPLPIFSKTKQGFYKMVKFVVITQAFTSRL